MLDMYGPVIVPHRLALDIILTTQLPLGFFHFSTERGHWEPKIFHIRI
jgi:hypothetical protein